MARDLNEVKLIGRLGDDVQLRFTEAGRAVANFPLATNFHYKNSAGQDVNEVQWHRCVLWGAGAETLSKNTRKGARLFVSGRLSYRQWEDREGAKRYSTDIVIDEFIFLDSAPVAAGNGREVLVEPPF